MSVGDVVANATTKMMFCSDIGVGFPDPSGRVCALVRKFERSENKILENYTKELYEILDDDAVVVPLFHASPQWLYSKDIDLSNVTPLSLVPRFDLIEIK